MAKELSFSLRFLLEKQTLKVDGSNFSDWFRAITIILRREKKDYVLNKLIHAEPIGGKADQMALCNKHKDGELDVQSLLVGIMVPELQRRFIDTKTYEMCEQLKNMFQEKVRVEKYKVVTSLLNHKLNEGGFISTHMLRMMSDVEHMEKLDAPLKLDFARDLSFTPSLPAFRIL